MDAVGEVETRSEEVKPGMEEDDGRGHEVVNSVESSFLPDGGIKVDSNGEPSHEERQQEGEKIGAEVPVDSPRTTGESPQKEPGISGDATESEKPRDSPSESAGSPPAPSADVAGTPALTKGRGLRKWRRIRRESTKEGSVGVDSSRALKRGAPVLEAPKSHGGEDHKLVGDEGEPESSVASVDDAGKFGNFSNTNSPPPAQGLDSELEMLVSGTGFAVGAVDSDNSEDRSSRSSASVSFPKQGYDGFGFGRDRSRARSSRGRGAHVAQPKGHRGKSGHDAGRKIRGGDRAWYEKDASRSSVESDLRTTKALITQLGSSTSNGQCSTGSVNFEKKNDSEGQASENVQDGVPKENGEETERIAREHDNGFHGENAEEDLDCCQPHTDENPFLEPIAMLQAAQEALEKEIEKFADMGDDDSVSLPGNYCEIASEETEGISSHPLESKVLYLCKEMEDLENELKEVAVLAEAKEAKIQEMDTILNRLQPHGKEMKESNLHDLEERCKELELELEVMFQRKLEIEIEHLALQRASQLWKVTVEDQWAFLKEQRFLGEEYDKLVLKLRGAEDQAQTLNSRAEELEDSCKALDDKVQLLTLQNRASKLSLCFFLQLFILCAVFWMFLMQLLPLSFEDVPT